MVYLPTFTIKINPMWVNIPYMDSMGNVFHLEVGSYDVEPPKILHRFCSGRPWMYVFLDRDSL